MTTSLPNFTSIFNDHFAEFVNDIQSVFPDDADILTAKNALTALRKANPKMLVKIWSQYIYSPYQTEIDAGDIQFFLTKDYSEDLVKSDNAAQIIESINRLRKPMREMSADNQAKTMKYIQNLSKLCLMCT